MCLVRKPILHNVFENPFTETDYGTPITFEYYQGHIAWPNRVRCFCKSHAHEQAIMNVNRSNSKKN